MEEIKFSHRYKKLNIETGETCKHAKLLEVINVNLENLSKSFIEYDTENDLFPLPAKGEY